MLVPVVCVWYFFSAAATAMHVVWVWGKFFILRKFTSSLKLFAFNKTHTHTHIHIIYVHMYTIEKVD